MTRRRRGLHFALRRIGVAIACLTMPMRAQVAPQITGLVPSTIRAGGPDFVLTVQGTGFQSDAMVQWNGSSITTTFLSATQVTAIVPQSYVNSATIADIDVVNGIPGGLASNRVKFTVTGPTLTNITPVPLIAGGPAITLTVSGTGFMQGAKVIWTNVSAAVQTPVMLTADFIASTELTVLVPANLIRDSATISVRIVNPDGTPSNYAQLSILPASTILTVVNGASFQPGIQDGSWTSIFGLNLSPTTRTWNTDTEIVNGRLPTSLDGVSVIIDGKPSAIYYISDKQLNVQTPTTGKTGTVDVVVTNPNGEFRSTAIVQKYSPALFRFEPQGQKYAAALIARKDGGVDYLGPTGLFGSGVVTRPAMPGEIIELFGTGFGPTNPPVASGQVFSGAAPVDPPDGVTATIGGVNAEVLFAGISGAGLYQINVVVPNVPEGDELIFLRVDHFQTQNFVFIPVSHPAASKYTQQ